MVIGRCLGEDVGPIDESMGGTGKFTYIYIPNKSLPNVGKYTIHAIHGSYGGGFFASHYFP